MKARVKQRNKIRRARLSGKLDAEAVSTKAQLSKGKDVALPSIPEANINAIILKAQMDAEVVKTELSTRKAAMLDQLAKRNKAKLERTKKKCEEENSIIRGQIAAGRGKIVCEIIAKEARRCRQSLMMMIR